MESVYPGIFRLQHSLGSNGYVVRAGSRTAVIDPGVVWGARSVLRELREAGLLESVTDILLTHHDPDHVGAASHLAEETGAVIRIGVADAEVLAGTRRPGNPMRRFTGRIAGRPLRGVVVPIDHEGEVFPGVRAVPTPGHTDGHVAFVAGEVLFAGDALYATGTASQGGVRLHQNPGYLTNDRASALRSEEILRGIGARWFCPGHGRVCELGPGSTVIPGRG